jgi:large subunit ribosomal protein L21
MYAIIAADGRQYKVEEGQEIEIDYREVEPGTKLDFDRVLVVSGGDGIKFGKPVLAGAKVTAEVISQTKGPKLEIQKFRRRKNSRRRTGHRQKYTKVRIGKITV